MPRRAKANICYRLEDQWFPECVPRNSVHLRVAELNSESFSFALFSLGDDLLSRAMFGSKHDILRWNDPVPESASRASVLNSAQARRDIRTAADFCHPLTNGPIEGTLAEAVVDICASLLTLDTFKRVESEWTSVLKQYAPFLLTAASTSSQHIAVYFFAMALCIDRTVLLRTAKCSLETACLTA